jgi:transcriptional regulator with XRE-family HTH domain
MSGPARCADSRAAVRGSDRWAITAQSGELTYIAAVAPVRSTDGKQPRRSAAKTATTAKRAAAKRKAGAGTKAAGKRAVGKQATGTQAAGRQTAGKQTPAKQANGQVQARSGQQVESRRRARPDPGREPQPPEVDEGASGRVGWVIANHVRSRRQDIGLNVGQLAERTGISKGMLSKIENAQTSPSLATLERLAAALDMPLTSLFRGLAEERDAVFVKADSGPEIVRQGTRAGHLYQLLGTMRGPRKRLEPLLVTLTEVSEVFPSFQHPGIELLYMLNGVMEYGYGKQLYRMEPGDTLQFDGDIPHGPTGLIKLPIRFLSITFYGDRA